MALATQNKKSKKKSEMPSEYHQTLDNVGEFMEYWGFKAVHGKIWACIFLAHEPVDANFIISQLRLSKASISLGIKDLLFYEVIQEVPKSGPSTQKYASNSDLAGVICNVLRQREKKMLQMIVRSSKALSDKDLNDLPLHPQKVEQLHNMTQQAQFILEQVLLFQNISLKEISSLLEADYS
ncbi:hypothetical protein K2X05_02460 [bacterium]|nr:hypothetical protein [bacterium]